MAYAGMPKVVELMGAVYMRVHTVDGPVWHHWTGKKYAEQCAGNARELESQYQNLLKLAKGEK